jgi:dipeptidyl aminopeptidase/acylaminoacyl peptidase
MTPAVLGSARTSGCLSAAVALAAVLAGDTVSFAQARRPLSLIDLAGIPRILDAQLSPDGQSVAYMLTRADWSANRAVGHIWRQPVSGGAPVQVTTGDGETAPRWSPDGSSLLFLARAADGNTQIFLTAGGGGAVREITRHATSVSQPAWSPDGSTIFFLATDVRPPEQRERERLRDDVYAFEEDARQRHLWRVTVATGSAQKVTDGVFSVVGYRLARDGRQIAVRRAPTPLIADESRTEVWLMNADGRNARAVTSNSIEEVQAELSPDGSQLIVVAEANERLEPYYSSTVFLVPAAGGRPRLLLPDFPHSIEQASWSPDGRSVLAVVNMGVHSEVFRIDVAARRATALTDGRHSVQFWSVVPAARRMIFQLDEPTRLGDAWTLPVDAPPGTAPTRVTGVYDSLARDFLLPRQEKITWKGADGTSIEGLLFYPLEYERGGRYPLVVQLHGGPQESDKFGYGPGVIVNYVPVLTAMGYAVLRPNYRGSSGYGSAFLRDVIGRYFRNMHLDVMAGVDRLIKDGLADPDRLALMGWSAGGHLTNKLITITKRFKAASSTAGAANWISLFAQTDTRATRALWFGGTPWQKDSPIDAFWDNSPLKDAASVTTPTLFIAGENDPRVPLQQAVEMYRALKANGVPTMLYVAPREGHQWGELRHQLFKANVELEWFERYVRGRPYQWERPPAADAALLPPAR